ncbi:MAG: hypothetical protein CMI15_01070 [Opitutaceae bacterium]|nr:hypothetical protein [Opitutaceae bacterium]
MAIDDHPEQRAAEKGKDRLFLALSGINGWSLVVAGMVSLLISGFARSLSGIIISLAILIHGSLELSFRKTASERGDRFQGRRMAFNQMGLATSVSLYLAYQAFSLEPDAVVEALMRPPIYDVLVLYPLDVRTWLIQSAPKMIGSFYALAAIVSWIVCGATAAFYWPRRKQAPVS